MHNTVLRHHEIKIIIIIITYFLENLYRRETLFPAVKEECNLMAYAKRLQRITYGFMTAKVRGEWRNAGYHYLLYRSLQLTIEQTCILLVLLLTCCAQETLAVFFSFSVVKALFIFALNISVLLGTDAMWIQTIKNNKPLLHILVYCLYRH
jgi:hypothetical protein